MEQGVDEQPSRTGLDRTAAGRHVKQAASALIVPPKPTILPPVPVTSGSLPMPALVADRFPGRLHRPEDLYESLACLVGIAFIVFLGVYAHATTQGVAEDVRVVFGSLIRQILLLPVSLIESLFIIFAPIMVIISLARRGRYHSILETIITGVAASFIGWTVTEIIPLLPDTLVQSLIVVTPSGHAITLDVVIIVLSAFLTVAGEGSRMRSIRISWFGVWFLLIMSLIRATATVPGILVTLLLGRLIGCLARYILGFDDRRALPADLVKAVLDIGLVPRRIIRADLDTENDPLETWEVIETAATPPTPGDSEHFLRTFPHPGDADTYLVSTQISGFADRHYQMWTDQEIRFGLHIIDPGRAITGTFWEIWNRLRLRGTSRWISPTIKANAERAVLTSHMAAAAGVRTPVPQGLAEAEDSVAIFWQSLPPIENLYSLVEDGEYTVTDDMLDNAWMQILGAHHRGVSHRNLDLHALALDAEENLWILGWTQGEVATSDLNRKIDLAQMLVYLALVAGPDQAMASAKRHLGSSQMIGLATVLQPAILPPGIRAHLRNTDLVGNLRNTIALENLQPGEEVAPLKLQRFAPRTVIMATIGVVALVAVFGSLNSEALAEAISHANLWWLAAAFLIGTTTWVGAAIPLVAFSPTKISLWNTTLAQVAASVTTVVAPAGLGPAAINLRFLTKHKIKMPVALATVTLVQISQFLTSVAFLLVVVVVTGSSLNIPIPSMTFVWMAAVAGVLIAAILAIPRIRHKLWEKVRPYQEQVYPQLLWVVGHPKEMGYAFLGNVLTNLGYIGAFGASLAAFGYTLDPLTLTLTFLISNTLGSLIPSPGGIGPVEAALTGGLQVAGIPAAVALSAAVMYRLLTFYLRIPFGWLAMRYLEKKKML